METQILNATEYRNVSLSLLNESKTNPRRSFEEAALKELAESIRTQGVLSPSLVRPLTENGFEIIAGARRYRAAQMAEVPTVPVRIVNLSDAQAVEMSIVENLQRKDVQAMFMSWQHVICSRQGQLRYASAHFGRTAHNPELMCTAFESRYR